MPSAIAKLPVIFDANGFLLVILKVKGGDFPSSVVQYKVHLCAVQVQKGKKQHGEQLLTRLVSAACSKCFGPGDKSSEC